MTTGFARGALRTGRGTIMSQISYAIRHAPQSQWLFRWQATVIVAIAGGSLTVALFNLSALMALSVARFASAQVAVGRRWAEHHA